jgi:Tol biopolymer transport system component
VVSIDYRLAPETKLPEIVEDVQDAFRWIRAHAPELSIDPARVAACGGSAGGYLTLMSGFCVKPRPKALVSFWGYGDIVGDWYSRPDPFYLKQPQVSREDALAAVGSGGRIAFISNRGDGKTFQVWTMQVGVGSGGQVTASDFAPLTSGEGDKSQPAWSPDGKKLLFVAPGGTLNGKNLGLDVWVMDADGSSPVDLTKRPGDDRGPAWSPDGKQIAFSNDGRDDKVRQIFLMNPDGSSQRRLSLDFNESAPIWSPDTKWLVYVISANGYPFLYMRSSTGEYKTPEPYDRNSINGRLG